MKTPTFDQLPSAIADLRFQIEEVKNLLRSLSPQSDSSKDKWMDLDELIIYDPEKRSKPTFYSYCQKKSIPFRKNGKKLIFLKSEIDLWLNEGRKKTINEIKEEAHILLSKKSSNKRI